MNLKVKRSGVRKVMAGPEFHVFSSNKLGAGEHVLDGKGLDRRISGIAQRSGSQFPLQWC